MLAVASLRSPAWLSRELRFALGAVLAQDLITALVVLAYGNTYLLRVLDTPPSYPAFAFGIYGLARVVSAAGTGWLADRWPARAAVLAGALEVAGAAIILVTGTAYGYFAGIALISIGTSLAWLLIFRTIGDASAPGQRASATALVGLVSLSGTLAGFAGAALLAELTEWRVPFGVAGLLAGVIALTLATAVRGALSGTAIEASDAASGEANVRSPRQRQAVAATVVFLHFSALSALVVAAGPFVLQLLDLTLLRAGMLLVPAAFAGTATMLMAGRRSVHGRRFREAAIFYGIAAGALVAIAPTSSPLHFAVGMVPLAAAVAGTQPLLNAGIVDASRLGSRPGQALGWLFFAQGLGTVAGPALTGLAIEASGVRAGLLAVAAMLGLLAAVAAWAGRAMRL